MQNIWRPYLEPKDEPVPEVPPNENPDVAAPEEPNENPLVVAAVESFSDVESDLPEDLKNEASLRFQAAIDSHLPIGSATEKVQEEVLSKCNDVFKGKRYKGFIRFEYESNVITINVSLFST